MSKLFGTPLIRQIWINGMIIVATIIVGSIVLSLVLGDIDVRAQEIIKAREAIATQNNSLNLIAHLQRDATTAVAYQKAINQLLPSQDNLIGFPQNMLTIARSYNLGI